MLLAGLLLVAVEIVARSGAVTPLELVPVGTMISHAGALLGTGKFLAANLLRSIGVIVGSFAVGSVIGIALALAIHTSDWFRRAAMPFLNVYYAVPTFVLYPIAVVLLGTGVLPIMLLSAAFAVVVITLSAVQGFDSVPSVISKLATSLELRPSRYTRSILLPHALPDIIAGLKLGFGYSIIAVLAAEFILGTQGLGWFIASSYNSFAIGDMYGAILIVSVLALLANLTMGALLAPLDWRRR